MQTTGSTGQQTAISKTDEKLIGAPNGSDSKPCIETQNGKDDGGTPLSLNAMIWDLGEPTPVTRGRSLKVRSDRVTILMGPIPRVQFNPPDHPDTATTATATAAVPSQETTSRETTQFALSGERTQ